MMMGSDTDIQQTKQLIRTRNPSFFNKLIWTVYLMSFFLELVSFYKPSDNNTQKSVNSINGYNEEVKELISIIKNLSIFKVFNERSNTFYYFLSSSIMVILILGALSNYLRKKISEESSEIFMALSKASKATREFILRNFEFIFLFILNYVVNCFIWKTSMLLYTDSSLSQRVQNQIEVVAVDLNQATYTEKLGRHSLISKNLRVNSISFFVVGGTNFISICLLIVMTAIESKRSAVLPLEIQLCSRRASIWVMRAHSALVLFTLRIETELIKINFLETLFITQIIFSGFVSSYLIFRSHQFNRDTTKNYLKIVRKI